MESKDTATGQPHVVGTGADVAPGNMRAYRIGRTEVLVIRDPEGRLYGLDNLCTHAEALLEMGELLPEICQIECPLHGGRFDYRTGEPAEEPCETPVRTYAVSERDGDLTVFV